MGTGSTKKKSKPALSTRIKRWYQGDRNENEAELLLAEYWEKELKKKPKSQGRRSRQKGAEFERLIANRLAALWPDAERNTQCKGGKKDGADIEGTPWFIEAKNCAVLQLPAWWRQARRDSEGDDRPIAIIYSIQNSPSVRVQLDMNFNHCDPVRFELELEDWIRWQRGNYGLELREVEYGWQVLENGGILGDIRARRAESDDKIRYLAARLEWCDGAGEVEEIVLNPHKSAVDGLWSTLDAAEAAVRRAAL